MYFPPVKQSLARPGLETMRQVDEYFWQRPEHFLPASWRDKIRLFDSTIGPRDIDQGSLGDCYFLCACASLAEHKKDIEAIFFNHHSSCTKAKEEKHGGWRVILNLHGWWKQIVIDSYLPSRSMLPAFGRNRRRPNELWPSFLEKAYAKGYGSYQAIEAGHPWQAQEDLTGYPGYSVDTLWQEAVEDSDAAARLFKMLERWNEKQYLISIATPTTSKTTINARRRQQQVNLEALFDKAGLATGHAYTVLDIKYFPLHRLCLLKIRNPWGNSVEWSGDWGDNSDMWKKYPTIKIACKPDKKANGVFWMEWNDVINFFDSGSVCFRQGSWIKTWHNYRVFSRFQGNTPELALEIVCDDYLDAFFTIHQKDKRGLPASDSDSKYAAIMISLFEADPLEATQTLVACSGGNPEEPNLKYTFELTRSTSIRYELKKGKRYFLVPRRLTSANGNNQPTKPFIISMHSSHKLSSGSCLGKPTTVNFVKLDPNNEVFRNLPKFQVGTLTTVTSIYQVRHGTDFFDTREGTSFTEGKKVNNVEYENMI
ncbi:calpain family cysteine protease-like protein [Angomonas deanei]|uniref:Calpain family cysteine protease, putative n=1 Tax=Angomonas deanei TaxID=59799 RepID=A0A7G2CEB8_9TRYP|nr:calpain family cysteine protease-like protein [Angomonas deanei]CAD2217327.1 Calpain family cysteine protease, putative [Angomonas deanei]|eukprot:EPY31064.1 calpain family cysteine protease-like protein [Angomonas deanei]